MVKKREREGGDREGEAGQKEREIDTYIETGAESGIEGDGLRKRTKRE